jgi:hypothetical protein
LGMICTPKFHVLVPSVAVLNDGAFKRWDPVESNEIWGPTFMDGLILSFKNGLGPV